MGLQLTGSSTQFWSRPVGLTRDNFGGQSSDGPGVTICAWIRATTALTVLGTGISYILGLGSSTKSGIGYIGTDEFGGIYVMDWSDSTSSGQYANQFNFNANVWTCVVGILQPNGKQAFYTSASSTPATLIQGGGSPQADLESFDSVLIGYQTTNTGFGTPTASNLIQVAEFAIWRGTLGSAEALQLFAGANPSTIQPGILYSYYPLIGSLEDHGPQHIGLTAQGGAVATYVDHPKVQPLVSRRGFATIAGINPSRNVYLSYPW